MAAPAEEMLDLVDWSDRVIGAATRAEIHARKLLHRAVHILVHDAAGRIYVQRRALHKDCAPGLWDTSAAGHVACGEDYADAAPRELQEELGLSASALEPLCDIAACADTGHEFVQVYVCEATGEPVPDPGEIAEAQWCEPAMLMDWMAREPQLFTGTFKLIAARYIEVARGRS